MPVGTGNIKLSDVTTEVYGDTNPGRSLVGCFAVAAGTFHPSYVGSKDRLSNFKGYDKRVYDQQGNVYGAIRIGDQVWMDSCLRTTIFRNGEGLTSVVDFEGLITLSYPIYVNYPDYPASWWDDGRSYTSAAIRDGRNLAPLGWHIPTYSEWLTLLNFVGGVNQIAGSLKFTGTSRWTSPNTGATNAFGFKAVGRGYFSGVNGWRVSGGELGIMAASTLTLSANDCVIFSYDSDIVNMSTLSNIRDAVNVRCIRNKYIELEFVSASRTALSITYTNKADGGQDGAITSRGIEISGVDEVNQATGDGQLSLTISDLYPETNYALRAYAVSSVYGTLSTYYNFTTLAALELLSINATSGYYEAAVSCQAILRAGTVTNFGFYSLAGIQTRETLLDIGISGWDESFDGQYFSGTVEIEPGANSVMLYAYTEYGVVYSGPTTVNM